MTLHTYDAAYFQKWYRDRGHRVSTPARTARKAALAVAVAEYYLGRPVRNALDVGCGEGQWFLALRKVRPRIAYRGIDTSLYAVNRYGRSRNITLGSFGDLPPLHEQYDLIICSDILYFVPDSDLLEGLKIVAKHLAGAAFLEAYPTDLELVGDTAGLIPRTAAFYRKAFRQAGLHSCGSHCYLGPALADQLTPLETTHLPRSPRSER